MGTEIITLETLNEIVPADVFKKGGINPILDAIRAEVEGIVPDTTTAKGRNAIASLAHKVAKSKALIDKMGKNLADGLNAQLKPINAERKIAREELDTLKEAIRHPLTEWETEQKRIADEEAERVAAEELAVKVEDAHEIGLLLAEKFDRELLEALAEEMRIEKAHVARIAEEAAEAARIEAEEMAREVIAKAEREKREAIEREQISIEREAQAKRDKIAAEERAKVQAEQAEVARVAAERQAVINAKNAAEKAKADEIARQEAENASAELAKAERLANRAHGSNFRGKAKLALVGLGLDEEQAKKVVMAIHGGVVPHIKITY